MAVMMMMMMALFKYRFLSKIAASITIDFDFIPQNWAIQQHSNSDFSFEAFQSKSSAGELIPYAFSDADHRRIHSNDEWRYTILFVL